MSTATTDPEARTDRGPDLTTLDAYRRWGYLAADLDWLGRLQPEMHPELATGDAMAATGRRWYCGTLGVEFMHMPDPQRRRWIQERMECEAPVEDREATLDLLIRAALVEQVLQSRYIGNKRFSIEGLDALLPLLAEILHAAGGHPIRQAVLAMSHRGRLNVMAQIVGKRPAEIFSGFEDVDPRSILGAGDVKYHLGATGTFQARSGREVSIFLVSNPSHLEAVNPVATGRVRAKQDRFGEGTGSVLLILMHGDAAFAGQGITAETLNLAGIPGFSIGGTVHVVVNNLIGFTAEPPALHSTRFASDIAKRLPVPIFHVNGEDLGAVVRAAALATEYRWAFASDVVIDLIGYRRHGHSEIDDPTITQPLLYKRIQERPPLWQEYARRIGADPATVEARVEAIRGELDAAKREAEGFDKIPRLAKHPSYWEGYHGGVSSPSHDVDTGLPAADLERLTRRLTTPPEGFHLHPKVAKLLEQRLEMGTGKRAVDFGMAEALAFASLVEAGVPVRLSGQDSERGTFNHRHAALFDSETGARYCPLCHVGERQARFEVYSSVLSEAAVLGFEYGYSRDFPEALVLWEAQFGDFVNGAQVVLDQFVTAGEDKWGLLSGLVVLLPHGFEGQGPEHSSARIERFLQLAAEDAIQVAQPSTADQYFHLLRRQALRRWRKPLIVFTPKSMLRHASAAAPLEALSRARFLTVLPDPELQGAQRIVLCTGKIRHELLAERERRRDTRTAILSIEQLYPFPANALAAELTHHPAATSFTWVQEEPANMGALFFVEPRIEEVARRPVRTVKRSASASPATGSAKAHKLEQTTLLNLAFS